MQKLANLDKYNFRRENLIERKSKEVYQFLYFITAYNKSRLFNNIVTDFTKNLKPVFSESVSDFRNDLENLLQKAILKGKTLNWLHENGEEKQV